MGKLESPHSCSHHCGVQVKAETLLDSVRLGEKLHENRSECF